MLTPNSTTDLGEQSIKSAEFEAFANASQLQELKLRIVWLQNGMNGEDWLTLAERIGSRLSNLRHVTLDRLTDDVAAEARGDGFSFSSPYVDAVARGFLCSVRSDLLKSQDFPYGVTVREEKSYSLPLHRLHGVSSGLGIKSLFRRIYFYGIHFLAWLYGVAAYGLNLCSAGYMGVWELLLEDNFH